MKVGDKVFFICGSGNIPVVRIIDGETKTCWKVYGYLFYKDGLLERGGSKWYPSSIKEYSAAEEEYNNKERRRRKLIYTVVDFNPHQMTLQQVEKMVELIDEIETSKEAQ